MENETGSSPESGSTGRGNSPHGSSGPVQDFIDDHTTVTVERATLRLAGADGADADGVPVPNLVVDQLQGTLEERALITYYVNALLKTGETVDGLNGKIAGGLRVDERAPGGPNGHRGQGRRAGRGLPRR